MKTAVDAKPVCGYSPDTAVSAVNPDKRGFVDDYA
jgi:hypothetical protein